MTARALGLVLALAATPVAAQPLIPLVRDVRVHGNHSTPDADVLAIAVVPIGDPATDALLDQAAERLRASGRFASVEVRRRFRSLDDPTDVVVIILVEERSAVTPDDFMPGPWTRIARSGMWLPIVGYADGYGFSYGARVTAADAIGPRSRLSAPLTWGGARRAAIEADRAFDHGLISRAEASVGIARRVNPFFRVPDTRREVAARIERAIGPWFRTGVAATMAQVSFGDTDARRSSTGIDVVVDTRRNPAFPRNAVRASLGWERLFFDADRRAGRWSADAETFVGIGGQAVAVLRARSVRADAPLPAYEWALLGGATSLRGYPAGHRAGENLAALSAELRVPLTSPLHVGRFGVRGFADWGAVYAAGTRLRDATFERGIGGGFFATATVLRAGVDVAWSASGRARLHATLGVGF